MEEKLNGIVISSINYGENDKILNVFTLEEGVVCARIKGVKKAGAKLKFASEPFCFAEFMFSTSLNKRVVIGASLIDSFYQIREDIVKFYAGTTVLEFIKKFSKENIVSPELFLLAIESLKEITYKDGNETVYHLIRFLLEGLRLVGYGLNLNVCLGCEKPLNGRIFFDSFSGGFFCEKCKVQDAREIKFSTFEALKEAQNAQMVYKEEGVFALKLLEFYIDNKTEEKINSLTEIIGIIK